MLNSAHNKQQCSTMAAPWIVFCTSVHCSDMQQHAQQVEQTTVAVNV